MKQTYSKVPTIGKIIAIPPNEVLQELYINSDVIRKIDCGDNPELNWSHSRVRSLKV